MVPHLPPREQLQSSPPVHFLERFDGRVWKGRGPLLECPVETWPDGRETRRERRSMDRKHLLETLTPKGDIIEVVFKLVEAKIWLGEELVILITTYRGRT